jgi:hypothetical protein
MKTTQMTELNIVMAQVPYSNCQGAKMRPFLVWRDCGLDYWGFPLTCHAPRNQFEVPLRDWPCANLKKPGTVRVGSGCPIAKERVCRVIGQLSYADADNIGQLFTRLFASPNPEAAWKEELSLALA